MKRVSTLTVYTAVLFLACYAFLFSCALDPDLDNKQSPIMELEDASDITRSGCAFSCLVSSSYGIVEKGFSYGTDASLQDAKNVKCSEDFTATVSGLDPGTEYFFLSFITGKSATIRSEVKSFQTEKGTAPVVVSSSVTEINYESAKCGGLINDDGGYAISAKGVCWSTTVNPTTSNKKTSDGSGAGSFRSSITDLLPDTRYYARAYATNQVGTSYGEQQEFTTAKTYVPTVTTATPTSITFSSAETGGTVSDIGTSDVTARGVCWSTSQNPTLYDSQITDGTGKGSFRIAISNLYPNTKYYVRAFATNSFGTSYGNQVEFTTANKSLPVVSTGDISTITYTSAKCGGDVSQIGYSDVVARGICWGISPSPTISGSKTVDGAGLGSYTSTLTGLQTNTKYYVRAYATNSVGTSYGDEKTFTTLKTTLAELTTVEPTAVLGNSAMSGGNIISDGGGSITARGVCWSTSENPSISGSKTVDGAGTGQFVSFLDGLSQGTKYYVRAYATNSVGTSYGSQYSFTTQVNRNYVDLSVEGTSNCYLVKESGFYSFKATVIGNGDAGLLSYPQPSKKFHATSTSISPKSAGVIWETTTGIIKDVSLSEGLIKFEAASSTGNALIAVYDDEDCKGNILWSWHIWLYDVGENITYKNRSGKTFIVMADNLGALGSTGDSSFGLFYQWGRKDPFPNAGSVSTASASSLNGTIEYTISHPLTFITSESFNSYDWMYPSRNNYLWGNPTGYEMDYSAQKSIYDPCPPGYMVAPSDTWTRFTLTGEYTDNPSDLNVSGIFDTGWKFYTISDKSDETDFYGAAGWRGHSDGSFYNVGTQGRYWSSSPVSNVDKNAGFMSFGSYSVTPRYGAYRAYGQTVRCVRE